MSTHEKDRMAFMVEYPDEQTQRAIEEGLARGIAWRALANELHAGPVISTAELARRWRIYEPGRRAALRIAASIVHSSPGLRS